MYEAIIDDIVAYLNGQTWSLPFTAAKVDISIYQLEDINQLSVECFPVAEEYFLDDRDAARTRWTVGIGIRDRSLNSTKTYSLLALVAAMKAALTAKAQRVMGDAALSEVDRAEALEDTLIVESQVFSHAILLTYTSFE